MIIVKGYKIIPKPGRLSIKHLEAVSSLGKMDNIGIATLTVAPPPAGLRLTAKSDALQDLLHIQQ